MESYRRKVERSRERRRSREVERRRSREEGWLEGRIVGERDRDYKSTHTRQTKRLGQSRRNIG